MYGCYLKAFQRSIIWKYKTCGKLEMYFMYVASVRNPELCQKQVKKPRRETWYPHPRAKAGSSLQPTIYISKLLANYATYVSFFRWHQNAVVMGEGRLVWWSRDPGSQTWDPEARWILGSSCKQHSPTEDLAGGWVSIIASAHMSHIVPC